VSEPYISTDNMGRCSGCNKWDDLRFGYCFDCACAGERRAAHCSILGHIGKGMKHIAGGYWTEARIDFSWAWERATRTGDYAPGGEFERQYGIKSGAKR